MKNLNLVPINSNNMHIYKNLAHPYEAEFSQFTKKMPNEIGCFSIDTIPINPYTGYLLFSKQTPIGFCVINTNNETKDVSEFYVIPVMRNKKIGCQLAFMVFNKHPGKWQVRQIEHATHAIQFWRQAVNKYTHGEYVELVIQDPDWGTVICQRFNNICLAIEKGVKGES